MFEGLEIGKLTMKPVSQSRGIKTQYCFITDVMCHCGAHGVQVYEHRLGHKGKSVQVFYQSNICRVGNVSSVSK